MIWDSRCCKDQAKDTGIQSAINPISFPNGSHEEGNQRELPVAFDDVTHD